MRYFFPLFLLVSVLYGAAHAQSMGFLPQGPEPAFGGPPRGASGQQDAKSIEARFVNVDYKVTTEDMTQEGIFKARAEIYGNIKDECAKIRSLLGGGCYLYSLSFNVTAMPSSEPPPPPREGEVPPPPKMIGEVIGQSVLLLSKD